MAPCVLAHDAAEDSRVKCTRSAMRRSATQGAGRLEQHDAKLTTVLGTTQLELEAVSERCWTGALHAASEAPDACNPS